MMKRFYTIFSVVCTIFLVGNYCFADEFDFEEFSSDEGASMDDYDIETNNDENNECRMVQVSINSDASPVAAGNFDIAGIMLGMSFDEAQMVARENGLYVNRPKNSVIYAIHKDWKYNLDYECRQQKVYIPEKLERCINTLARNRGVLYASELHLVRDITGETIDVYFTSNATDNVVWKIVYKNDVNLEEGAHEKFENQKNKKIMAWWQGVLEKYGDPNSGTDKWVSSDSAYDPLMTAYYGELELVDCGRQADDSSANMQQAMDNFAVKPYAF
jgi:hypothetical protein